MGAETSAKLPQIAADNRPRRRAGGAPARWMALGALLGTVSLGAACGGGSETTAASDTVVAGASAAATTDDAASVTAPASSTAPSVSTATVAFPAGLVGTGDAW